MNDQFDLITIGDSTIDTFIKIHDATVECDINKRDCKLCVDYGSKIPVDSIGHEVAGNAANVAVGGARIGLKTAIYTNVGDDEHGKTIAAKLKHETVSQDYIEVHKGKESNLSVVLTFQGERTIFVYHQAWYYKLPALLPTKWIYLTSLAETFTETNIYDEVCHYIEKSGAKMMFGPGTHQLKADLKRFPKILTKCDVLIVNIEEAKKILGYDPSRILEAKDILSELLLLGPKNVVITDGVEGSYATDGKRNLKAGVFPTTLVEKTGAGDAYSSGLLGAMSAGLPLEEAMIWGTINASSVIQQVGPQKGLLSKEDVERYQKSVFELVAVEF